MENLKTCSPGDNFEFACKPKKSKICSAIFSKNAVQVIFATHKYNIIDLRGLMALAENFNLQFNI